MATVACVFSGFPESNLLNRFFSMPRLDTLRFGKLNYIQYIKTIPCIASAQLITIPRLFPHDIATLTHAGIEELKHSDIKIQPDDNIILFNLSFYPLDIEWLENLLRKSSDTDIPLLIKSHHIDEQKIAILCIRYKYLTEELLPEYMAQVAATDKQLADLLHSKTVLRLLSSNFSLRHFNSLNIHHDIYFLKRSNNKKKMHSEHFFLKNIPSTIRPYFPHVGELLDEAGSAAYEVEIIPYTDVAKSLLNGIFGDNENCRSFVSVVEKFLTSCPRKKVSRQEYESVSYSIFVDKTRQRVEQLLQMPIAATMDKVCRLQGWETLREFTGHALRLLEEMVRLDDGDELCYSHGDLFFANMLFEPVQGTLKLVDPRGCLPDEPRGAYLPIWYDLAKLSHSFLGLYDLMVYEMMDVVMGADLKLFLRPVDIPGLQTLAIYFRELLQRWNVNEQQLRTYEAALFLSMLPLHIDSPFRMQCQLLRAMELFSQKEQQ